MSEITSERLADIKQRLDEAHRQVGDREWIDEYKRDVSALIDHIHAQNAEIERLRLAHGAILDILSRECICSDDKVEGVRLILEGGGGT